MLISHERLNVLNFYAYQNLSILVYFTLVLLISYVMCHDEPKWRVLFWVFTGTFYMKMHSKNMSLVCAIKMLMYESIICKMQYVAMHYFRQEIRMVLITNPQSKQAHKNSFYKATPCPIRKQRKFSLNSLSQTTTFRLTVNINLNMSAW